MEQILNILFAPVSWVWGALSSLTRSSLDASDPGTFLALLMFAAPIMPLAYALLAFAVHHALTSLAQYWRELLRERAERGTVDAMLKLAVQAERTDTWLYSLASRTGVTYDNADRSNRSSPELPGADKLPRRRALGCLILVVDAAKQLIVSCLQLLWTAATTVFGLYTVLGTAWTLHPEWFTASAETFHDWTGTWNPASFPAAIGLVATVLGLIAAYAFSTKRRARFRSMFDAAVDAENTLAVFGSRAGDAAREVAKFAHVVARHDRHLYENTVEDLSNGQLYIRNGQVVIVDDNRADGSLRSRQPSMWRWWQLATNNPKWQELCKQRRAALTALNRLRDASSQMESLTPLAHQAGKHSWTLLQRISPRSSLRDPWCHVSHYSADRYEKQREDLRIHVNRALKDEQGSTDQDDDAVAKIQQLHLEQIGTEVERLQTDSRSDLWHLAELYAELALCNTEVYRSRRSIGMNALIARFLKT